MAFVISCQEQQIVKKQELLETTSIGEVLSFDNSSSFNSYLNLIQEPSYSQRSSSDDFISFYDHYQKVLIDLDSVSSQSEYENIIHQNSDIVYLQDSSVLPRIKSRVYQMLCNRQRVYITGSKVIKVLDDKILLSTNSDNYNLIRDIESEDIDLIRDNPLVEFFTYSGGENLSNSRTADGCTNEYYASYYYNPSGCKNDRKVFVQAFANIVFANFTRTVNGVPLPYYSYRPIVIIYVYGEKRNWLCNWDGYATGLSFNARLDLPIWERQSIDEYRTYSYPTRIIWYTSGQTNGDSHSLFYSQYFGPEMINEGQLLVDRPFTFTEISVSATSRGTNSNYATIQCPN